MEQSYSPLTFRDIDNHLEGRQLSESEIRLFEESYQKYIDESKENKEQMEKTIEEIANLVTVNQNNFESFQNQNWFTRAWKIVSGKNSKLEKISQLNLLKIQKGALFFLQNLAEINQATMESVIFAIKRVEDIQIENIKLKGYLSQIVLKYNNRIKKIENKLIEHDIEIKNLNKNDSRLIYIFFSVLLLLGSLVIFILTDSIFTKWIVSGILLLFSFFFLILLLRNIKNNNKDIQEGEIYFDTQNSSIVKDNQKLRTDINNLLSKLFNLKINDHFISFPFLEYFNIYSEMKKQYEPIINNQELNKKEYTTIFEKIISYELCNIDRIYTLITKNISEYIDYHSQITSSIVNNYFPNSIGIELFSNLDIQIQNNFVSKIEESILPYEDDIKQIILKRISLINDFKKFKELYNESILKQIGKYFLEGFTFGFIGNVDGEDRFVKNYINELAIYVEKIENIVKIFKSSIIPFNSKIYEDLINVSINKIQSLLDEFDKQNISIKPLYLTLKNGLIKKNRVKDNKTSNKNIESASITRFLKSNKILLYFIIFIFVFILLTGLLNLIGFKHLIPTTPNEEYLLILSYLGQYFVVL